MRTLARIRRRIAVSVALVVVVVATIAGTSVPAAAADGPPEIHYTTPQVARTVGGTPIRIYGTGFEGTTAVTFGGVPALDLAVIDGALLTATVPPAAGGPRRATRRSTS